MNGTRYFLLVFCVLMAVAVHAQLYSSALHVGWNTLKPLSDTDYIGRTSSAGIRLGFTKLLNDKFGVGLEGSYNTMHEYVPRQTYDFPGGAITTDVYNYHYYFTIMANGQYIVYQGRRFLPYIALGMGVAFSEYRLYYNIYEDNDTQQGFVVRPEVGTLFRIKEYSHWGLKAALSYDYANTKSAYFEIDNFSGINLMVGVVMFTD